MKKSVKVLLSVLLAVAVLLGGLLLVITHDYKDEVVPVLAQDDSGRNPYIVPTGETMISAHRSGGGIAPENTLMAFQNCVENEDFSIDVFEFDLHLTKDEQLILLHDGTLDRVSDAEEVFGRENVLPRELNCEQLLTLNMGEGFVADDGSAPYKGLRGDEVPDELRIMRLSDVFDYLKPFGEYFFIIELKDGGETGRRAADRLYETLKEYGLLSNAVIGTFHGEISEYIDKAHPELLRSASIREVIGFYFSSLFGIRHAPGHYRFEALQIPDDDFVVKLGTSRLINYAHKHNIAVQYWTINKPEDVKRLAANGADAIMSDYSDMVCETLRGASGK